MKQKFGDMKGSKRMADDRIIYAQVLLLDNKIEAWKICQDQKRSPYDFKAFWKQDRINDYTMDTFVFYDMETYIENGWNFNSYVYNILAPRWINEWEYADDYKGSRAKEITLEEQKEFLDGINKAFGGRFEFVGQLGAN